MSGVSLESIIEWKCMMGWGEAVETEEMPYDFVLQLIHLSAMPCNHPRIF